MADELEQLRDAHPHRRIELAVTGDCCDRCDGRRLQQLLRNLVLNAIKYWSPDSPVRVALRGDQTDIRLEVTNGEQIIDTSAVSQLFDPLKRGVAREDQNDQVSLGLGLLIVREGVRAHGGEVKVRSDRRETAFAVRLPRHQPGVSSILGHLAWKVLFNNTTTGKRGFFVQRNYLLTHRGV